MGVAGTTGFLIDKGAQSIVGWDWRYTWYRARSSSHLFSLSAAALSYEWRDRSRGELKDGRFAARSVFFLFRAHSSGCGAWNRTEAWLCR